MHGTIYDAITQETANLVRLLHSRSLRGRWIARPFWHMAIRSSQEQEVHDKGVLGEARVLEAYGWEVCADLSGRHQPLAIKGHIPDIYAVKGLYTRIIEIETNSEDDHEQHSILRKFAKHHTVSRQGRIRRKVTFYGWIVGDYGRRIKKFR